MRPEHPGKQHQVIIMYPHKIIGLNDLEGLFKI
jgi:hypothetical protein